jgi:hypothetical protein
MDYANKVHWRLIYAVDLIRGLAIATKYAVQQM